MREQGATDFGDTGQAQAPDAPLFNVSGLTNGTRYDFEALAEDAAGNQSALSDPVSGTPVQTAGFLDLYKQRGGSATGCAGAPGEVLACLSGLGLWACWRKRR